MILLFFIFMLVGILIGRVSAYFLPVEREEDVTMTQRLNVLKDLTKIQTSEGNWNYDSYMHGMANGMLCSVAVIEDREPLYLTAPKQWLRDKPLRGSPTVQS